MDTPTSNSGPLGQPRGIGFAILMAIITLGIYTLYWVFKTQDEVKNHSGQGVGGVLGLVIYIVVGIVTWFLVPSEVGKMYQQDGRTAPFSGWTGLWLLLPIVGAFNASEDTYYRYPVVGLIPQPTLAPTPPAAL